MIMDLILAFAAEAASSISGSEVKNPQPRNNWVTNMGYPKAALRNGWEGIAKFTVTISTDGRAVDCVITESTGHSVLDLATCEEFTKRARFRPATGPDGKPEIGQYTSQMKWVISRK
jgi:periplasmic protein TonB